MAFKDEGSALRIGALQPNIRMGSNICCHHQHNADGNPNQGACTGAHDPH